MVHACFVGRWVEAKFQVADRRLGWAIDGLNLKKAGERDYVRYDRVEVTPPELNAGCYGRNLFSPSGSLIAVVVDKTTGKVSVDAVHSWLNAGKIHQPDLVSGQYQGGVAMGVGYALLENLPPDKGGSGQWNLNRYHVALAGDLPLEQITLETLPPIGDEPGRGIAEAVLCPIVPAIANAVAAATGGEFYQLPITPQQVKEAVIMNDKVNVSLTVNGTRYQREVWQHEKLIDFLHDELDMPGTRFCCGIGVWSRLHFAGAQC